MGALFGVTKNSPDVAYQFSVGAWLRALSLFSYQRGCLLDALFHDSIPGLAINLSAQSRTQFFAG